MRMTKPQLHRHLTTGIFNQLSKILKKFRLSDFFLDRAAGKFRQVLELCALRNEKSCVYAILSVFCATKSEYQESEPSVNSRRTTRSGSLASRIQKQSIRPRLSARDTNSLPQFQRKRLASLRILWMELRTEAVTRAVLLSMGCAEFPRPALRLHGFPSIRKQKVVEKRLLL